MPEAKETEIAGTETPTKVSDLEIAPITLEVLIADGYHLFEQQVLTRQVYPYQQQEVL